jgi:aryl carrier-like protein
VGWRQKAVLLAEESILRATERLKRRGDRTDFSDLMQALLEAWLQTS